MSAPLFPLVLILAIGQSPASNHVHLKPLEFLIGDWAAKARGNDQELQFSGKWAWALNQNFIASEFKINADGAPVFGGTGMLGWDAKAERILGWGFHSDGKYFTSKVTTKGKSVTWDSTGINSEGKRVAETVTIVAKGDDTLEMVVSNRKEADQSLPGINLVWTRVAD